jgi:hypothetical protein
LKVPVEVKANKGRTLSMDKILSDPDVNYGYKFSSNNLGREQKKITLPIYMIMFISI